MRKINKLIRVLCSSFLILGLTNCAKDNHTNSAGGENAWRINEPKIVLSKGEKLPLTIADEKFTELSLTDRLEFYETEKPEDIQIQITSSCSVNDGPIKEHNFSEILRRSYAIYEIVPPELLLQNTSNSYDQVKCIFQFNAVSGQGNSHKFRTKMLGIIFNEESFNIPILDSKGKIFGSIHEVRAIHLNEISLFHLPTSETKNSFYDLICSEVRGKLSSDANDLSLNQFGVDFHSTVSNKKNVQLCRVLHTLNNNHVIGGSPLFVISDSQVSVQIVDETSRLNFTTIPAVINSSFQMKVARYKIQILNIKLEPTKIQMPVSIRPELNFIVDTHGGSLKRVGFASEGTGIISIEGGRSKVFKDYQEFDIIPGQWISIELIASFKKLSCGPNAILGIHLAFPNPKPMEFQIVKETPGKFKQRYADHTITIGGQNYRYLPTQDFWGIYSPNNCPWSKDTEVLRPPKINEFRENLCHFELD